MTISDDSDRGMAMNEYRLDSTTGPKPFVTLATKDRCLRSTQDFLDLVAWAGERGADRVLAAESNFVPAFYDLSTGLAGEILQKVSNYHVRLAIVGSFDGVTSKSFRAYMSEANEGSQVRFSRDHAEAVAWLLR